MFRPPPDGPEGFNCLLVSTSVAPTSQLNADGAVELHMQNGHGPRDHLDLMVDHKRSRLPNFLAKARLISGVSPVLRLLQVVGYFPMHVSNFRLPTPGRWYMCILPVLYLLFNSALFGFNMFVTHNIKMESNGTILTVDCISSIITGLKPCHNSLNLLIFFLLRHRHLEIMKALHSIDQEFRLCYSRSPVVRCHVFTLFVITVVVTFVAFVVRLTQYFWLGEIPGNNILSDMSLVFVCFLSTWQVLPLFYFEFLNRIVRYWYKALAEEMFRDRKLKNRSMKIYYDHYVLLSQLMGRLGRLFNPFLFSSMCVSVLVLCLTIYFLSEAQNIVSFDENAPEQYKVLVYFLIVWSVMQIAVAVLYVVAICITGTMTNEEARKVIRVVLLDVPQDETDRYYAIWFINLSQRQMGWGLSIWKAFPLERPLLFTLMSAMGTYAALLLKLKNETKPCKNE